MRRRIFAAPAMLALGLSAAFAAQPLASLYQGQTAKDAGIVLGGWGSGTAKETKEEAFQGSYSILVTTDGYYAGARFDFVQPVDMSRYGSVAGAALRFTIKAPGASSGSQGGGLAPGGGFFYLQGMPGPPMGMPGMPGMPGMRPGALPGTSTEEGAATIATKSLRVVLYSGTTAVAAVDQAVDPEDVTNGWIRVRVPLAAFKGAGGTPANWSGFRMNRLLLFGDTTDSFFLGQMDIMQADLAITGVSAGEDQEIYEGDVAEFTGTAANAAGLTMSWDFDASDGIQDDAFGKNVSFRYRKAGTYTVTLTVSDPNGVMKPVSKTTVVKVNG